MSLKDIFAKVDSAAHTFVKYAAKTLGFVQKYVPQIADAFNAGFNYIEPLLVDVITIEFGKAGGDLADKVLKGILQESMAAKSFVYDWGVSGGVVAKIQSVLTNVNDAIAVGHIKDPEAVAKAQRVAQELKALIDAYASQQPTGTSVPAQ